MVSVTNEQALEESIEQSLIAAGYQQGNPHDFDKQFALDKRLFFAFLQQSQSGTLAELKKFSPNDWQEKILSRYNKLVAKHGLLYLLKKGLKVDNAELQLLYPAPLASSSAKTHSNYQHNIFSCSRQVRYSLAKAGQEIDMVLFVNGLPLATLELKNAWTGQTAANQGILQYKKDRDPKQALLQFGRCLVHMAVDTDEVYMTTKLAGDSTYFLPFNKGHNFGKGNPPNPSGHKTAYLWQEIFSKQSWSRIIEHFLVLDGKDSEPLAKRTLFFPRYHQFDVVRQLMNHASTHGVGQTYLIQHSAGSGKSNSITWAAYQLIEAYPQTDKVKGVRSVITPLFDSVIVVTDRRLLDKQIRDNIQTFASSKSIIAPAKSSADLRDALNNGKKIIITTIQKFPHILDGISDMSDKRFAVIIDEAHSSQSGSAHDNMNAAMGGKLAAKEKLVQASDSEQTEQYDKAYAMIEQRKIRSNASYFAFTATPKNSTLEKFGQQQTDGSFVPFHLYSMKQAIQEGFILDVLSNYSTYQSYYEITKSILDNPEFDNKKAQKKLKAYVEGHQQTIDSKAEIMLDHFMQHVIKPKKLKGKAKGMVVTQSIESAIRYYMAFTAHLAKLGNPFKVLIAFSGEKTLDDKRTGNSDAISVSNMPYTEASLNGFPESDTKDYFDVNYKRANKNDPIPAHVNQDEYRLLIVANKYLTGFDQPKLCAMYVDKKLDGVLCVQTLSRLNRSAPKWGKRTQDLSVLDFFNTTEDIQQAFDPFYTSTMLTSGTDINVLHDLKDALDDSGVYDWQNVVEFSDKFFDGVAADLLSHYLDETVSHFDSEFEPEAKIDFKVKAKQFVKIYAQMAGIMPYGIPAWERLYWFLKLLIPKLTVQDPQDTALDEVLDAVDLNSYALTREKLNTQIDLTDDEGELEPQNSNPRGQHNSGEQLDPLDEIIAAFNERWFQDWNATPEEQRVKFINIVESIKQHPEYEMNVANNRDPYNSELAFEKILKEVMLQRRRDEMQLYKLYAQDPAFKSTWSEGLRQAAAM